MSKGVRDLFSTTHQEGTISDESLRVLEVDDVGANIQASLGIGADEVTASEAVLVTMMPDDSGSIRFSGNTEAVRDGHNAVLGALSSSKQNDGILAHTRYLNGKVLFAYRPLSQAVKMDSKNYLPQGETPLYDQAVVLLGTVLAKTQEFSDNGVPVRTVTLIITDGADTSSENADAEMVKSLVDDMYRSENHIIAGMGISDGVTNFKKVFKEMGIRDEWILTPGNNPSEIRKAFMVFSQSAVRASQNANSFSKTSLGGFGSI